VHIVRKLIISVVVQALLLTALGLYVVLDARERARFAWGLVENVRHVEQISRLLHEVQRERGYSTLLLGQASRSAKLEKRLHEQRQLTDAALAALQERDLAGFGSLEVERARVDKRLIDAEAAIREYSRITGLLLERLNALTKPDGANGELALPLTAHMTLARVKEYAGLERALVGGVFAAAAAPRQELAQTWTDITTRQQELLEYSFLTTASSPLVAAYRAAMEEVDGGEAEKLRHAVRVRFAGGDKLDPETWFDHATRRVDALARVEGVSLNLLRETGTRIANAEVRNISLVAAMLLLAFTTGIYYVRYALRSIAWPIRSLHQTITALAADPNSEQRADSKAPAELGQLASAFNELIDLRQQYDAEVRLGAVAFEHTLDGLLVTDATGAIVSANPGFCHMMGYAVHELGGRDVRMLESGGQDNWVYREMFQQTGRGGIWQGRLWNRRKDGQDILVRLSVSAVHDGDGDILYFVGVYSDITEQYLIQQQLQRAHQYNRLVIASLGEGVMGLDADGAVKFLNPEAERLLKYQEPELIGKDVHQVVQCKRLDGTVLPPEESPFRRVAGSGEVHRGEIGFTRRDGRLLPVDCIVTPLSGEDGTAGMVVAFQDISLRKQAEEEILYLAHHDSLTGLPNRRRLEQHLQFAFSQAKRFGRRVAVLMLDLDRFKQVNDTLGHPVGDALLVEVSKRIKGVIGESDLLARLAGDEFVLVISGGDALPGSDDYLSDHTLFEAMAAAQKLLDAFLHPLTVCGHELYVSPSIGISLHPFHTEDTAEIIRQADQAMYRAKELGGNTYALYSREFNDDCAALGLETRLRRAIRNDEFVLFYQPIVDLKTQRVVGVEALVRWRDGDTLIAADEFIPFAEQTGLIIPIGDWAMREACRQTAKWRNSGHEVYVAVNLSPRHLLRRDLARWLRDLLAADALPPSALVLEVTEQCGMAGAHCTRQLVTELGADGVRLVLDDFGTGYSCLTRLRDLPVNALKIGRSFTADLAATSNPGTVIVKNVIALAQDFGLTVLADGVETASQWRYLQEARCDLAQGYYFCPPLGAGEITTVLERSRRGEAWFAAEHAQEQPKEYAKESMS
jgi:diguanylate cyclase (GGDEF)-like protein/PAS domain S-box-containing protein